jgi:hypothetical protein
VLFGSKNGSGGMGFLNLTIKFFSVKLSYYV